MLKKRTAVSNVQLLTNILERLVDIAESNFTTAEKQIVKILVDAGYLRLEEDEGGEMVLKK